ncbi:MAG: hypothetical protein K6C34_00855 [Alphaproteobacteria bacterium]|nr:hypothetical protein [Alphaproteobacteria bacterium]
MLTMKGYFHYRYMQLKALFNIKRYERMINRAWKRSLELPEHKRAEVCEKLLYHEANLAKLKAMYNEA